MSDLSYQQGRSFCQYEVPNARWTRITLKRSFNCNYNFILTILKDKKNTRFHIIPARLASIAEQITYFTPIRTKGLWTIKNSFA